MEKHQKPKENLAKHKKTQTKVACMDEHPKEILLKHEKNTSNSGLDG